ncbi:hypothetical protein [Sphaerisporangium aureirubrum]|uniref:Transcriptional regulator n=1 Tax=Sphaerisporangium aureirubrum TaxID=1544736 RepID=A0ABW1NBW2_9ACTN
MTVAAGSDFEQLMSLMAGWGTPAERIAELRAQVVRVTTRGHALLAYLVPGEDRALGAAPAAPETLTIEVVDEIRKLVDAVNAQVGSVPFGRLQVALAPAVEACRILHKGGSPGPVRTSLAAVAANAFMVAARVAFETRDDHTSTHLYTEAIRVAESLPAWERVAIRTSQALVTLYSTNDVAAAQLVADEAVRVARRSDSRIMRARAHALQAEMAARAGRDRHAFTALHQAWHDVDSSSPDTGDPAAGRFGTAQLEGFEGTCNLYLGRSAESAPQLSRALSALSHPRQAIQRAIVTADLAWARLQEGAPEASARLLHDCVDLVAATRARVPAMRGAHVRRALTPWRRETFVADLDDHMRDVLAGI